MRFLARSLIGLLLAALTAGLVGYGAWRATVAMQSDEGDGAPQARAERVHAVQVGVLEATSLRPTVTAYGEVRSARKLEVRALRGGRVTALAPEFRDGGRVAAGELLLQVDPAAARSDVARARIALREAEAEAGLAAGAVILARRDLQGAERQLRLRRRAEARQTDLRRRGVGTEQAVEAAELAVAAAEQQTVVRELALSNARSRKLQADIARDRAALALEDAQRALAETEVRAPFAGLLSDADIALGRQINPGERLAVLLDPAAFEASVPVTNAEYARLLNVEGVLPSRPAVATLELGGQAASFAARLDRADAASGQGRTGRTLFVQIEEDAGAALKEGDFISVEIAEDMLDDVAQAPASAVDEDGEMLIVDADERLRAARVRVLRRLGDAVIVAQAPFGARYVLARTPRLGAGIKVRPLGPPGLGGPALASSDGLVTLTSDRRAALAALVAATERLTPDRKAEFLARLEAQEIERDVLDRLEKIEAADAGSGG